VGGLLTAAGVAGWSDNDLDRRRREVFVGAKTSKSYDRKCRPSAIYGAGRSTSSAPSTAPFRFPEKNATAAPTLTDQPANGLPFCRRAGIRHRVLPKPESTDVVVGVGVSE
jgi:hypothetical protein